MFKRFILLLIVAGVCYYWVSGKADYLQESFLQYVESGDFLTFETRYSAEQLMQNHRKELLPTAQHIFHDPYLKFYPYLLMEVKYAVGDKATREGMLIWGQMDGEMVLDTESWETTHGFEDALKAGASRTDFKIIRELAQYGRGMSKDQLQKALQV